MPAHLTPSGEFTVRIERGAVAWYCLGYQVILSKYYMKRYWEPHGRVRATKFEIARSISA